MRAAVRESLRLPLLGVACGALAGQAVGTPIADSVADFGDQGDNGWFYGYTDQRAYSGPGDFELMTFRSATSWRHSATDTWTFGNGTFMHGNAPNMSRDDDPQDAIRRWESDRVARLILTGEIADADTRSAPTSNGVTASIWVNGAIVYEYQVALGDDAGAAYSVEVDVGIGSVIDYVVSSDGDPSFDTTLFTSRIEVVPGPSVSALLGGAGVLALRRRRPLTRHGHG